MNAFQTEIGLDNFGREIQQQSLNSCALYFQSSSLCFSFIFGFCFSSFYVFSVLFLYIIRALLLELGYLNWNWNFLSFRFDSVKKKLFSVLINWACVLCDVQLLKRIKWGDCLFYFYFSTSFNMAIAFDADADADSSSESFCHIVLVLVCVCVFSCTFHHNNYYWILFLKCFHGEASSNQWLLLLFLFLSVKLMWFMTALSCVPLKFLSCTLALPFVCFMLSQKVKRKPENYYYSVSNKT